MCEPTGSWDPILLTYKVTRTDTGETKYKAALTPGGAIKLSLFPPSLCEVEVFEAETIWVEPDETGD